MFQSTRPHGARPLLGDVAVLGIDVSIHAPARGATGGWIDQSQSARVSIHAPARGATLCRPWRLLLGLVSIHAPARGATGKRGVAHSSSAGFNPRARTGRDWSGQGCSSDHQRFQSTRPHGARLERARVLIRSPAVSIHAPARGATRSALSRVWSARMFQSTRPHGARRFRCRWGRGCRCRFNPRARTGRDAAVFPAEVDSSVSIHAPARGATTASTAIAGFGPCFNPRARTGRDSRSSALATSSELFQSTRPHGARRCQCQLDSGRWPVSIHAPARGATLPPDPRSTGRQRFNPRARTGRDGLGGRVHTQSHVSIHAPARGATARVRQAHRRSAGFNPRARTGRDGEQWAEVVGETWCFNPRARTGRDLPLLTAEISLSQFQSTRPHGARLCSRTIRLGRFGVSIHAPARGATGLREKEKQHDTRFNPRARTGRDRCVALPVAV